MILLIHFLKHNYDNSFENQETPDKEKSTAKEEPVDLSDTAPLKGDEEELKETKGPKMLTPNKQLP